MMIFFFRQPVFFVFYCFVLNRGKDWKGWQSQFVSSFSCVEWRRFDAGTLQSLFLVCLSPKLVEGSKQTKSHPNKNSDIYLLYLIKIQCKYHYTKQKKFIIIIKIDFFSKDFFYGKDEYFSALCCWKNR